MVIELTRSHTHWVLKLDGDMAAGLAHLTGFTDVLEELDTDTPQKFIIDFSTIEYIDLNSLRHLLIVREALSRKNIQLVLRNPNYHLKRLLQIMQFHRMFEIEP